MNNLIILTLTLMSFTSCLSVTATEKITVDNQEVTITVEAEIPQIEISETLEEKIPEEELTEAEAPDLMISRTIYAKGTKDWKSLYDYFCYRCPKGNKAKAKKLAKLYIEECDIEGINSDVAFIQMCHETGFLNYGNLVKKEWNNFCGLGAISKDQPGLKFKTLREGVRAHVQHLHAYGTTKDVKLNNELIDSRYKYVNPRGKAKDIFALSGTWAADKSYGEKLDNKLKELERF